MRWRIWALIALTLCLPATAFGQTTAGQPFVALQQQIDQLNSKLNNFLGRKCDTGKFVTGFTATGELICDGIEPPAPQQTTYTMACDRGFYINDPFDDVHANHANFSLEVASGLTGSIAGVGVEISDAGGASAYIELKDGDGNVLATSESAATTSTGWIGFKFTPAYAIDRSSYILNFVVTGYGARVYNCSGTVPFTPTGLTAYGLGIEGHLARSYIKINN
jgi:hypothetical protein